MKQSITFIFLLAILLLANAALQMVPGGLRSGAVLAGRARCGISGGG